MGLCVVFCSVTDHIVFFIQLSDSASSGQQHINILVRVSVAGSSDFWNAPVFIT